MVDFCVKNGNELWIEGKRWWMLGDYPNKFAVKSDEKKRVVIDYLAASLAVVR